MEKRMVMAAGSVAPSRELAAVPTPMLARKLHAFFSDTACAVFHEFEEPNTPPTEQAVQQQLTTPLQWILCGGDPVLTFAGLEQQKTQSNFCGKVFKSGEPAYFCKDCQTDPTCCLCMDCFEHSEHKNHRYRLFASGGGGCCDCGDPEAWTSEVHCQKHKPTQQRDDEADPVESLPSDLVDRARVFFYTTLWYCMDVLSWEEGQSVPTAVHIGRTQESLSEDKFLAFLYNDEVHSYDEVIHTLTHNVKLQHSDAVALATFVDRKGRAVTKVGSEDECLRCNELVNTGLDTPLTVHAYHTALVAHQHNAIYCINLLKELAEKSPAFCRLISQALLKINRQKDNPCCVLDKVFLIDSKLWIAARITWHRLILGSIYMDSLHKKDLAITLAANYCQLQKNFVADSHHHDVCASNMTVQLFTVPSLSRMLVLEHGLLRIIVSTLLDILTPCKDPISGILKLRSSNYKHSRVFYIMYDLRYVLRNKPEVWTEQLREQVLGAFEYLLDLLGLIQNSDPVRRQRGAHVEREEPWEHSFNFSIVLQPAILMFIEWCCLDRQVLQRAVTATLKKHEEVSQRTTLVYKQHSCEVGLVGQKSIELVVFDILKDHVSIHQPLPRVIASLLAGADAHGMTLPQLLQCQTNDCNSCLFLMEHCSRAVVMASQVMAGMWKRNGYSVVNQIINYQFHYSKEIMYDRDILMLQCMASILDPSMFLYALIYKFRLEKWLGSPLSAVGKRGEPKDDQLRFLVNEIEEFLFLLIIIFSERYIPGIGRGVSNTDALKREIIHRLYIAPQTHSELVKQFRLKENENEIDKLLKEVAVLKRTGVGGKSVFELKSEYEKECSPFFYHYTRMDHSKASEARRKRIKELGGVRRLSPSPPERPPPFTAPFEGMKRLTCSPVLHRVIQCVLKQSTVMSENRVWSDKLLHEVLFLCGLMFIEEDPTEPTSLCKAAIGQYGDNAFFDELEQLLNNPHAKEHLPLLSWIIQYLRSAREHGPGTPTKIEPDSSQAGSSISSVAVVNSLDLSAFDQISQKKKQKAMEQRERLMAQISAMQRRFLDAHQQELEEVDMATTEQGESDQDIVKSPPPRCAVGVVSLLDHIPPPRALTCILCQEESKDTNSQEKPFVQAVFIQRSAVLRRGQYNEEEVDFLSARADLPSGTFTSGCGHHMHAECWRSFLENKQQEHRRSFFFPIPGQSVQWQSGEFLCPLCQCYGNTVLPLMLHIRQCTLPDSTSTSAGSVEVYRPMREIKMEEWKEMVDLAIDLAGSDDIMDTGSSVDPTLLDKLEDVLPGYRKPTCHYSLSEGGAEAQLTNIQALFSQAVYMRAYRTVPDETSDKVSLSLWDNCAYTITSLERNARYQDTFLLQPDSLSSRQLDNVRSLVRLGCEPKVRPSLPSLVKYTQQLTNSFLHTSPPFSELPCILEVDSFHMLVNLHFTLSSLFAAVTCPHGPSGPNGRNPVLPALIGITDQHLIRITAASHILQYLITCPPCPTAMDVDTPVKASSSGPEFGTGVGLQELWLRYRKLARLPINSPPSPYDLFAGVREHLYSFLESSALFFYCLSGIDFVYSSAASGLATRFEDLCQYTGIPSAVHTLFAPDPTMPGGSLSIPKLANHWCSHPRLADMIRSETTPPVLQIPRQLIELPVRYSDLVKQASTFQCPQRSDGREYSDDGQAAMLCLVCGEMLCTNSYCCQKVVEVDGEERNEEDKIRIGGFTQHAQSCGAGLGMALWILESYVVLLDVTDVHNVKGCTVTPPYLDEYGETDPGLRRGNPLKLNVESYKELRLLWFHHRIPERISTEMEGNRGLLRINWSKM